MASRYIAGSQFSTTSEISSTICHQPSLYIDEPISWESVVANVKFTGGRLEAVTLEPVVMNEIGVGQPDVHDEHTNNQFLDTRGLPSPATGLKAIDILGRVAHLSEPYGTKLMIKDGVAEIALSDAH